MRAERDFIIKKIKSGTNSLIMVVGDSITWGLNHCSPEQTFCAELARMLAGSFPDTEVIRYDGIAEAEAVPLSCYQGPISVKGGSKGRITLVRSGVGGDTVRRAIERNDDFSGSFITGELPDCFLLMFGINDALESDPSKYVEPETYYFDLCELIGILESNNPQAQIVLMTPTYNDLGNSRQSCLEPYRRMMKMVAEERGFLLIDTHKLWMEHLIMGSENYGQRGWLSGSEGDSCHFSPEGSRATAEFILKNLLMA